MRFGTALPCVHPIGTPPWPDDQVAAGIEAVARQADALGYEWVTCCDHAVVPRESARHMGTRWFDATATLGFVAGMTSRVKLLSSVFVLPYRTPFDLAKSMGTLDSLSNGRVILGVGVGHLEREFRTLRANYEERGAVTDETIQAIKALWSSDSATFHGAHVRFDSMMVAPRPAARPHPPVWVGGNSQRAVRRAVRYAEGWHPFQVSPAECRERVAYAQRLAPEMGRGDPLDVIAPVGPVEPAAVAPPQGAQTPPAFEAQGSQRDPYYVKATTAPLAAASLTTNDEVCQRVQQFVDAGATAINVGFRYQELGPLLESMDWFAREVMPRFA
ncbi:MAG: TIGR03619 family F420-dependent LLM class oxidoreductase [Dehalococcoidia bacterium]